MATVNYDNPNKDKTVNLIDKFYDFQISVDANLYDIVVSYFQTVFTDDTAAKNFALNLFRISEAIAVPAITLLDDLRGQNEIELSVTFSYYLNNIRSNSTLLGVSNVITPNYYAARNVLI